MSEGRGSEKAERVRDILEAVATGLDLDARVEIAEDDDAITGTLHGEDLGLLIGRRGQTIDAVQHLAYKAAARLGGESRRVVVDAAGYQERRRKVLEREADAAADVAVRDGEPVALDAMSAHERKVVHEYLKHRADVETHSEGTEPDRHLVVSPARSA